MRRIATLAVFASAVALALGTTAAPALAAPADHGWGHGPRYYLALGDSLSVGIQPDASGTNVPTDQGYPDQLAAMLQWRGRDLRLVKLGCSGETTVTLIDGGICSYPGGGTQLTAATQFLRQHRGHVGLVTIDIGANDLNPCVALGQAAQIQTCLTALIPHVVANLTTIMSALRQAGGSQVQIIGMRYYDPELASWLTGRPGRRWPRPAWACWTPTTATCPACTSSSGRRRPTCSPPSTPPTSPIRSRCPASGRCPGTWPPSAS